MKIRPHPLIALAAVTGSALSLSADGPPSPHPYVDESIAQRLDRLHHSNMRDLLLRDTRAHPPAFDAWRRPAKYNLIPTVRTSPLMGNPNPWAALIDANDVHEGFEYEGYTPHVSLSALADLRPLDGQVAPSGNTWKEPDSRDYNGIVDNAIAQTGVTADGMGGFNPPGSGYSGPPGGPDPAGSRGRFLESPRGSVWDITSEAFNTSFEYVARLDHTYFLPLPDAPVVTIIDWRLESLDTFTWFRPVSSPQGLIVTNIFMGGFDEFDGFPGLTAPDGRIDRPIMLPRPTTPESEFIVAKSHRIKEGEWFNVAIRQAVDSASIWIRDSETIGVYGFTDASTSMFPADTSVSDDGVVPFEGEIFERDWVQIYPGVNDDPATPLIEGSGISINRFNWPSNVFLDASGSPVGNTLWTFGIEELQIVGGFDPTPGFSPTFRATDWYADNYTVMGEHWCPGDLVAPSAPRAIDGADLAVLLADWGAAGVHPADLNADLIVDGADLAILLARWGASCIDNEWVAP